MNFKRLFVSSALALTLVAGTALSSFAKTYNSKVRSGKPTQIFNFSVFDPRDCGAMAYPKVEFKKPTHGTITIKRFRGKLTNKGHCNGKLAKGMAVYYKSDRGYRGVDKAKVYFSFPRGVDGSGYNNVHSYNFNINVK